MAVTDTPQLALVLKQVTRDFPDYNLTQGDNFVWHSATQTIEYAPVTRLQDLWSLLHELAHAQLNHTNYSRDIGLIRCEAEAWQHATDVLAPRYSLTIDDGFVQDSLATYRIWLDNRSRCPTCNQNGVQTTTNTYSCINCRCLWRVNDARGCRLQRTRLQGQRRSV